MKPMDQDKVKNSKVFDILKIFMMRFICNPALSSPPPSSSPPLSALLHKGIKVLAIANCNRVYCQIVIDCGVKTI